MMIPFLKGIIGQIQTEEVGTVSSNKRLEDNLSVKKILAAAIIALTLLH